MDPARPGLRYSGNEMSERKPPDAHDVGCPFLALSLHQTAANGSKRRHTAKV
jgi:hypothetical protein